MTTLTVELPEEEAAALATRAQAAGFASTGEFLAALARAEAGRGSPAAHEPHTWSEIETKVLEALHEEGPRVPMTPEEWESIRREGRERLQRLTSGWHTAL